MRRNHSLDVAVIGAVVVAFGFFLALSLFRGQWILDSNGRPIVTDFLPVYVAGKLALGQHASQAYDWRLFHQIQARFIGHPFAGFLGWHYPPLYFVVAAAIAILPYLYGYLVWVLATLCGYTLMARRIADRGWFVLALPPVLACAMVGQNGLLSAALLGMMLLWLPGRPCLAGLLLAALGFKPQFAIVVPLVLAAAGHWKTLGIATVLTIAWIGFGYAVSPGSVLGFLEYLPETSHAILVQGAAGWGKLQSPYGLARLAGADNQTAWAAQIGLALLAASFCIWLWRSNRAYPLKAAALSTTVLLATPYVYYYDLPLLAVPLLFLVRDRGFDRIELAALTGSIGALIGFAIWPAPLGLAATFLTAGIVLRRLA